MHSIYYNPEKFGLIPVDQIDWSSGCYEFDITAVWKRIVDGQLLYAEDSGCSCPSPFESVGIDDLTACTPQELQAHLEGRNAELLADEWSKDRDRSVQIAEMMKVIFFPRLSGMD